MNKERHGKLTVVRVRYPIAGEEKRRELNEHLANVKPRPPLFCALGASNPPLNITINGQVYDRETIIKHDSWAATALYRGPAGRTVCKFNRQQSVLGLPMRWLGRLLAKREKKFLRRLAGVPNVPQLTGDIYVGERRLTHAVNHDYVPGHTLRPCEKVGITFFEEMRELVAKVHRCDVAHVDLHKRENILVGNDGKPYLLDFQISFALPKWWPGNSSPVRALLRTLQQIDIYHLHKHIARSYPDYHGRTVEEEVANAPRWIRLHRRFGVPLRSLRRDLLVKLGIRRGGGYVQTEKFTEEGLRVPNSNSRKTA